MIQSIDLNGLITCTVDRSFSNVGFDGTTHPDVLELKLGDTIKADVGYIVAGALENK